MRRRLALTLLPLLTLAACGAPRPVVTVDQGAKVRPREEVLRVPAAEELKAQPADTVRALLGRPTYTRVEPPAEVWQYAAEGCVLDITFYPERQSGPLRSSWLESRDIDGKPMDPTACLPQVVNP